MFFVLRQNVCVESRATSGRLVVLISRGLWPVRVCRHTVASKGRNAIVIVCYHRSCRYQNSQTNFFFLVSWRSRLLMSPSLSGRRRPRDSCDLTPVRRHPAIDGSDEDTSCDRKNTKTQSRRFGVKATRTSEFIFV